MADLDSYHDMCQECGHSGGKMFMCDGDDCPNVVCIMKCAPEEVGETFYCGPCKALAKAVKEATEAKAGAAKAKKEATDAKAGAAKAKKEATEAKAGEAKEKKRADAEKALRIAENVSFTLIINNVQRRKKRARVQ